MASSAQPSRSKFSAYGVRANPSSSFASADEQGDRAEETTIAKVRREQRAADVAQTTTTRATSRNVGCAAVRFARAHAATARRARDSTAALAFTTVAARRLEQLSPEDIQAECRREHRGACATFDEHVDLMAGVKPSRRPAIRACSRCTTLARRRRIGTHRLTAASTRAVADDRRGRSAQPAMEPTAPAPWRGRRARAGSIRP
jgi:hypothetical protein